MDEGYTEPMVLNKPLDGQSPLMRHLFPVEYTRAGRGLEARFLEVLKRLSGFILLRHH